MRIHVKLLAGCTATVEVPDDGHMTVAQLKAKVQEQGGAEAALQGQECRLLFAGKELEDDLYLSDYSSSIMHESELHLLLRVRAVVDAEREPFRGAQWQIYPIARTAVLPAWNYCYAESRLCS